MVKTNLRYAGASDPGKVRSNNEDAFYVDGDRAFFLVVDGIGGQAAGEKAAEIAVERVRARLERQTGTLEQRIREAIAVANNEIYRVASARKDWKGMACVLTLAAVENGSAVIGHVGDSRLYQIRRGQIRKITHDHSPVGEREDSGELSEAEAMRHPRRNEVFRDVGSEEHAPEDPGFIEVVRAPFEPDSALVLCSDGLSDMVTSATIQRVVEQNAGNPDAAVRDLIEAANLAGGKDNVTVVVVEGERFRPGVQETLPERKAVPWFSWTLAGFGVVAGLWAAYTLFFRPKPVVEPPPAILLVGSGGQFPSIAAALTQARAGDTVEVPAGEYREQLILKTGVNLRSSVPGGAILRAASLSKGPILAAQNVTRSRISGFRILADQQGPLAVGIALSESSVEVDDVEIVGAETGIEIRGAANPVLRGNSFQNCGVGVLVAGASQPWVSHNTFRRSKVAGVAARDGARPWLLENVFDRSAVELTPNMPLEEVRTRNIFIGVPQVRGGKKK